MARRCEADQHTFVTSPPGGKDGSTVTTCSTCGAPPFDYAVCPKDGGAHDFHCAPEHHELNPPAHWVRCAKCHEEIVWPPADVRAAIDTTKNWTAPHYHALRAAANEPPRPRPDHGKAYREELRAHRAKATTVEAEKTPAKAKR